MSEEVSMEEALEAARKLATEHGKAAASWVFDGNTPDEYYAKVLKGLEEGDPEVYDSIGEPSFSGEYADDYSERQLCDDIGVDYDLSTTEEVDEIAEAYLEEVRDAFWGEVERLAREHLSA